MNKICLIYNYAQHYRKNIFMLMDKELLCDFVFGDTMGDVKKLDYSVLFHFKKEIKNKTFLKRPLYWQKGVFSLLREDYTHFIMLGETICVSTWLMLFLIKLQGKKIYFWSHGWYGKEVKIRIILKKIFYKLADGIFLYGNYAKKLMIANGLNENKLHVIYNSLDYDEQIKIRKKLVSTDILKNHFKNHWPNLVFVGRLTKVKQLDMLLQALSELNKHDNKYNLTFIGDGEMKPALFELTQRLNVENNVWFYGATYNETELSELIYNADLCVSPGNVGLTAMHTMAYGCPVVTHDNFPWQMPEFEAIEHEKTGDFFQYNDLNSLVEVIQNWFKQDLDRETIRQNCFEVIDTKYNPHYQLKVIKENLK
jgi:glycosyltransferase involved in cell wall biosynthesis